MRISNGNLEDNGMRHYDGYRYDYSVTSEAWYASSLTERDRDTVMVHRSALEGGCAWEIRFTQRELAGQTLEMTMFGDAWDAFQDAPELFHMLREEQPQTLAALVSILRTLGFVDETAREDPNGDQDEDEDAQDEHAALTADVVVLTRDPDTTELKVLLIERHYNPFKGLSALPGGKLNKGEWALTAAVRELAEEAGLEVDPRKLVKVNVFAAPDRDPRGRFVSFAYVLTVLPEEAAQARAGSDAARVEWAPVEAIVDSDRALAFDHNEIVRQAVLAANVPMVD